MSFINRVASAFFFALCVLAKASVYRLSKDLTTAANDSFTDCFELVLGVKHAVMALGVYVDGTLRADQGRSRVSKRTKHVCVHVYAELINFTSQALASWLPVAFPLAFNFLRLQLGLSA